MGPPLRPTSFASPKRKEILEASKFDKKSILERTICDNHFNHAVDVFLPGKLKVPSSLKRILANEECEYYLVKDVSLSALLDYDFICAFVRKGQMNVISHGTRMDVDNCVSLRHSGQLVLSLNKDSYEEFGLQGKPSTQHGHRSPSKYVVTIELLSSNFYPGRKLYDKVMMIFKQRTWLKFSLLLCWKPHDDSISRRSLYNYIKKEEWNLENDAITICNPHQMINFTEVQQVPRIDWASTGYGPAACNDHCTLPEFIEWLGVVGCQMECGDNASVDPFISTYSCPNPIDKPMLITHAQWCGLFSSDTMHQIVDHLREMLIDEANKEMKWAAAVVHGFEDVPMSVSPQQHRFDPCYPSATMYAVVVFPSSKYWLCKTT